MQPPKPLLVWIINGMICIFKKKKKGTIERRAQRQQEWIGYVQRMVYKTIRNISTEAYVL